MKKEILEDLMFNKKLSYRKIYEETGVKVAMVAYYAKKYNLVSLLKGSRLSKEELYDLYINHGLSIRKISNKTGHQEKSITDWIHEYGIQARPKGTNQNGFIDIEKAREIFKEHGHELLESEYKNSSTTMKFRCRCGNEAVTRLSVVKRGSTCVKCARIRAGSRNKRRPSFETVKKFFSDKGCKLLSTSYVDSKTHLEYICHCGAKASMTWGNFKRGYDCVNCKRIRLTGPNNHNWNPDLTEDERLESGRKVESYRAWRSGIYRKFGYTCFVCKDSDSRPLQAHHLDSYKHNVEKRADPENGVCLCEKCHKDFHKKYGNKNNTKEQFEDYLDNLGVKTWQ